MQDFLASIQALKTRKSYEYDLKSFLEFAGDKPITAATLDGYRSLWIQRGVAAATINRKLSAVRAYLTWLVRTGQAEPAVLVVSQTIKGVRKERNFPRLLTDTEVFALLQEVEDPRNRALILVLLNSGLRISEALDLNAEDIDYESSSVVVRGKGSKDRVVFFNQETLAAFARLPEFGPLFVNNKGGRLTSRSAQRIIQGCGLKIGRPDLHPHLLRHQFATTLLRRCGRLDVVQDLLGHADPATTRIYAHLANDEIAKIYQEAFDE